MTERITSSNVIHSLANHLENNNALNTGSGVFRRFSVQALGAESTFSGVEHIAPLCLVSVLPLTHQPKRTANDRSASNHEAKKVAKDRRNLGQLVCE